MTDEQRAVIRRFVDGYLPHFEAGEAPTVEQGSFFMRMIEQAEKDEIIDDDYVMGLDRFGGWDTLKDLELIGKARIDDVRVLLTAALRSGEYREKSDDYSSVWREYAQAGTFTAILRRLDQLERED